MPRDGLTLTRLSLGYWETEVVHRTTGDVIRIDVSVSDLDGLTDDFGRDRIDKLKVICEEAFALKELYLEQIIGWRESHFGEPPNALEHFEAEEIRSLEQRGINTAKLALLDETELRAWAKQFLLDGISVGFSFHYEDYDYTKPKVQGVFMSALVLDPSGQRWSCSLGGHVNRHECGEGWIEYC
jgi:hypothetical protein